MARKRKPDRDDDGVTPAMARVIVHHTFAHKLKNGSVQVLNPRPEFQIVKRDVADGLIACGRGELAETVSKFNPEPRGTD